MPLFQIALIICTYNRDKYLPEALESIKLQTIDKSVFCVIVVDNNSTDNTAAIVQQYIADNPAINTSYYFEENKGLSYARNRGLKEANAKILCYVDDDSILTPTYLENMLEFFQSHPNAVGVGGKVIPKYETGKEPEWMNKYLIGFIGQVNYGENIQKFDQEMKYPAGCNMTYTKAVLQQAGGFNNSLTFRSDDKYIFYKVQEIADEIYYVPNACVHHYIDNKRLEISNFKKLFLKTGNEEKIRIKQEEGTSGVFKKFIEYTFKLGASVGLFLLFAIKGTSIKGKYIVLSQYYTLKGFLSKTVFVR